ncbi:MAG TPA: RNase A-like domain-containing protein [Terriglobales bacterium]|nr:RNase A-like domain-containing protein [Terriglobales bacterium]
MTAAGAVRQLLLFIVSLLLLACGRPPANLADTIGTEQKSAESSSKASPHDLSADEARGGHTLKRHVGRTDDELLERLSGEHIGAASTYSDRGAAEAVVGAALVQNRDRIRRWLLRKGGHPNLVLDYDSDRPVGRTLHRGDPQAQPCSHAILVLKYDGLNQYHVLTSYPECR